LVGFDGFIDSLYRVIRDHKGGVKNPYVDIPEFGREILSRAGRSGGFELSRQDVRAGGNAPLMSAGLSALGVATTCVGALGPPPGIDPAFDPLREAGCELFSAAPAALTNALEFDDGKLMLNDSRAFEGLDWSSVARTVGARRLGGLAQGSDLIALVGWANMPQATDLWRGLLEEALPAGNPGTPKKIFVDLADISRAGAPELLELAALLRRYRSRGAVALGLNENEALKLAERLGLGLGAVPLEELTRKLYAALGLDLLVIHPRAGACVVDLEGVRSVPGRLVEKPLLSTGGGDHFNAGFCYGWLLGLPPVAAARLGVLVSSLYVERGRSPKLADLKALPESAEVGLA
jgi:sugar/nucleoside kinase (ribokinase family)